jgi:hypothetical protein
MATNHFYITKRLHPGYGRFVKFTKMAYSESQNVQKHVFKKDYFQFNFGGQASAAMLILCQLFQDKNKGK